MKFVLETAPDPTTDVGIAGAQAYILEKVPEWVEKYGKNAAYFCTNDAHTEPLLKQLLSLFFYKILFHSIPLKFKTVSNIDFLTYFVHTSISIFWKKSK